MRGWAAERHGAGVELLELVLGPSPQLRSVRSVSAPQTSLDARTISIECTTLPLSHDSARKLLERARIALSVRVQVSAGPSAPEALNLRPLTVTSSNPWLVFVLSDSHGMEHWRSFAAYITNDTEPDHAPLAEAWQTLTLEHPQRAPRPADAQDAQLLVEAFRTHASWPDWAEARMLALAAALPSRELIPMLARSLDGPAALTTLAVNALAAASGRDLRA